MNKYLLTQKIEKFAPLESADSWDCVGYMVETSNTDVSKVMICLTPTDDVIRQAVLENCDMIISHHPMFYVNLTDSLVTSNNSPKIDIYSAHTNMDKANGGTTDTIITTLGFKRFQKQIPHEYLRYIEFPESIKISELIKILQRISPNLRYVNNKNLVEISRVCFCAGSGTDFISDAKALGADCLVTADLKFHTALDSDIAVFDIGHFESEILIRDVFKTIIGEGVQVVFANEVCPFIYP